MISILIADDILFERKFFSALTSLYNHPLPNPSSMQISHTNLYFFFLFRWVSNAWTLLDGEAPGSYKLSLKLIGVLLSWDSFRSYAIYISFSHVDYIYSTMLYLIFLFAVSKNILRHFTCVLGFLKFRFRFTNWFESRA